MALSHRIFLPAIKGLLADAHFAGNLFNCGTLLGLMQRKGDLLLGKSGPLHRRKTSFLRLLNTPKIKHLKRSGFWGAGHHMEVSAP